MYDDAKKWCFVKYENLTQNMKRSLLLLFTLALLISGCKKSDVSPTGDSSWTLGSTTYKGAFSVRVTNDGSSPSTIFNFFDAVPTNSSATLNTINFTFKAVPAESASYELISLSNELVGNRVQIAAGGPAGAYAYLGSPVKVQVTVTGGKVKIVVPEITMKSNSTLPDAKLTANVQEMN